MVIYDGDKILTTYDDTLPMIEIDENYSTQTLNNDLQFLVKVNFIKYNFNFQGYDHDVS